MANNRMYLVHKPSKTGVYIGKRMGHGWYCGAQYDTGKAIAEFYEYLENNEDIREQDEFILVQEDSQCSECYEITTYIQENNENGRPLFEFKMLE